MKIRTFIFTIFLILLSITILGMLASENRIIKLDSLNAEVSTLNLYYLNITKQYNFAGDIKLSNTIPGTMVLSDVVVSLQAFDGIVNTTFKVPDIITLQSGESFILRLPDEPPYTYEAYDGNYVADASTTWDFKMKMMISGHAKTDTFDGPFMVTDKQSTQIYTPEPNPRNVYFGALDNFHGPIGSD